MKLKNKLKNKICNFKNRLDIMQYKLYNIFSRKIGIESSSREQLLIVSLTTYPK